MACYRTPCDSGRQAFPALEAAPAILSGGACLIPKPEAVLPAELACSPGAAPREGEPMGDAALRRDDLADEIRAARTRRQLDTLDAKLGVRVEELREHTLHLDPRRVSLELEPARRPTLQVLQDLTLELWMCGGGFEKGEQLGHRRRGVGGRSIYYKRFQSEAVACLRSRPLSSDVLSSNPRERATATHCQRAGDRCPARSGGLRGMV